MGAKTGIEWTDATWNPILGCSRVSEGCRNCYAESIAGRFGQTDEGKKPTVYDGLTQIVHSPQRRGPVAGDPERKTGQAVWTGKIVETKQLLQPLSWRTPKRVFVNSMSDLFHENVTDEQRDRIFAVMALCPQHTFQVLTKRPERMKAYIERNRRSNPNNTSKAFAGAILEVLDEWGRATGALPCDFRWPLPNVWLGVSVENQAAADERIPLLLQTPAAVRFLSCEPLLGPVSLEELPSASGIGRYLDALSNAGVDSGAIISSKLDWIICGGESGPHARPMHPDWARSLRDQCQAAGVPFFFKQWGEWTPGENVDRTRGIVETASWFDNRWLLTREDLAADEGHIDDEPDLYRVGKKAAGALLDGCEWKQFPEGRI